MKKDLMDILCCPMCKSDLVLKIERKDKDEIIEGFLICSSCGSLFEIDEGIPNFLPPFYGGDGYGCPDCLERYKIDNYHFICPKCKKNKEIPRDFINYLIFKRNICPNCSGEIEIIWNPWDLKLVCKNCGKEFKKIPSDISYEYTKKIIDEKRKKK